MYFVHIEANRELVPQHKCPFKILQGNGVIFQLEMNNLVLKIVLTPTVVTVRLGNQRPRIEFTLSVWSEGLQTVSPASSGPLATILEESSAAGDEVDVK